MGELRGPLADARAQLSLLVDEIGDAASAIDKMVDACAESLAGGGKILLVGNGGSAAQCQHLATELMCRLRDDRQPYAAIALTTDTSFLTACSNDYAFEHVFSRQIEAIGRRGDVLIALSTGGRSPNVVAAAQEASRREMIVLAFTGSGETPLGSVADETIAVPSVDSARIQEIHLLLGHVLCTGIEARLSKP